MDDGLADLLHRIVAQLGDLARERMDDASGLTYSQLRMLGTLDDSPPMTQHQVADAVGLSEAATSRALQPLRAAGFIDVIPDPSHGRRKLVSITQAGRDNFHQTGQPLVDQLRAYLTERGFPYDDYLRDTAALAAILAE
jgi:DNA-binding MarR family transcriptional regulator